jgi:hypothetical protein
LLRLASNCNPPEEFYFVKQIFCPKLDQLDFFQYVKKAIKDKTEVLSVRECLSKLCRSEEPAKGL